MVQLARNTQRRTIDGHIPFLANQHYSTTSVTLDANTAPTADANGDQWLKAGTVLGKISATGLYGPYDPEADDGREVAEGILLDDVNLRHGDASVAMVTHGSVYAARCTGLDSDARGALAGRFYWFE